jgi:hypothetical protein
MFFNLPLSKDKDLTINTSSDKPFSIKEWTGAKSEMQLTREETAALLKLLQANMDKIIQDLPEEEN